jgi:ABC-type lipoprotein release transport system permease subunit
MCPRCAFVSIEDAASTDLRRRAVALGVTVAVLLFIGALGSLVPALRASRLEPTEALRSH